MMGSKEFWSQGDMAMSNQPVRVLTVAPLGIGGVTNMMINIQKHLDREKVNFDYLVFHDRKEPAEDKVAEMGSKKLVASVDHIGSAPVRRLARLKEIKRVCRENDVRILHYNADSAADLMNIIAAKAGGVRYVTIHSHNAGFGTAGMGTRLVSMLLKPLIPLYCDNFWGCSDLAARFLLPKSVIKKGNYSVLPNGIELDKFRFNEAVRQQKRKELGIESKFVVGHAGRFSDQKNHTFLLDIFAEIRKKDANSVLLLFGVGELMDAMKEKAKRLGIDGDVIFYGASNEMEKMWQAMDVFLMPSLHEGLPVTGIEAQACGLPCVFSDEITKEVDVVGTSVFLPLSASTEKWADAVLSFKGKPRADNISKLRAANYDINTVAKRVSDLYLNAAERIE